jgi:asparagine synthase (glutamine-hydrolysing)
MKRQKTIGKEVRLRKLTYLTPEKLRSLMNVADSIVIGEIPGDFLEFGVALGGSGICLASRLETDRRYLGFDVFGMIPPPSEADGEKVGKRYEQISAGHSKGIEGDPYYGYVENLQDKVAGSFREMGFPVDGERVLLVKGLFEDTVKAHPDVKIALAHVDCDWYDSVKCCLEYIWPRLSEGGQVIMDDYNFWEGARRATDEFLVGRSDAKILRRQPQVVLLKAFS